ncbi:MAG: cobalamin biosynthesis protein CobW [Pseudomonadota bacterium]
MNGNSHGKIPATVITGFLGAGKTSLIRHLLSNAGTARLALIINEFGDLGVDREILKGCGIANCDEEDIVELANGCICCTVADDFLPTMRKQLARSVRPDHILIETSGLALPKPLVKAFAWPEVRNAVTVDGVVAVVDAPAAAAGLFAHDPQAVAAARADDPALDHDSPLEELFEEQIACADLVVLNKTDAVERAGLLHAEAAVDEHLRQGVKIVHARHGNVDPKVALGLAAGAETDLASRPSHIDAAGEHDHDDFMSFTLQLPPVGQIEAILNRCRQAVADHPIYRIKGFIAVDGRPMRCVIQGVGNRFETYYDQPWADGEGRFGHLVVIGDAKLDQPAITQALLDGA